MKKLTFMDRTLESNNGLFMYRVEYTLPAEWMAVSAWINKCTTEDYVISSVTRTIHIRDVGSKKTRLIGLKSRKDTMAFVLKFGNFQVVHAWDCVEKFKYVQFVAD